MGIISAAVKHMLAAGMDGDAIVRAVADMEADAAPKKTARQLRNARYYEAHKASEKRLTASNSDVSDESVLNGAPPRARVEDKPLTQKIEPQEENKKRASAQFDEFWLAYPNKVGKPKAREAFIGAARKNVPFAHIMAGLQRYIENKPPDRAWLNPSTFLNQERWDDQPGRIARLQEARAGPRQPNATEYLSELGRQMRNAEQGGNDRADVGGVPGLVIVGGNGR